jgi:adenylylsulfate kinase
LTEGVVVWFTGLPSSGKSSLAAAVRDALGRQGVQSAMLDGDEFRAALVPSPGYDDADRSSFYATLANVAALLARQGMLVLVAATANRRAYREHARRAAPRFLEVYVSTPLDECARRDAKGLYGRGPSGQVEHLPGVGAAYEPPLAPEVVAPTGSDEAAVARVLRAIRTASSERSS